MKHLAFFIPSLLILALIFLSCKNPQSQLDGSDVPVTSTATWSHPADISDNISPGSFNAFSPKVAMDDNGNAIIVWSQLDGIKSQIFMSESR